MYHENLSIVIFDLLYFLNIIVGIIVINKALELKLNSAYLKCNMENAPMQISIFRIKLQANYKDNIDMGTTLDKSIGSRLKHFRKMAGYTQEQLAELVDCETSTIAHCENGKDRISLTLLSKIADTLNVELYKFFLNREPETDIKTLDSINTLLMQADRTQLGLIYNTISNILDLT